MTIYSPNTDQIVHEVKVDFVDRLPDKPIHLVQYDSLLPVLAVKLNKEGRGFFIPDNANANLRYGKNNNKFVCIQALGCNVTKNIVYFEVPRQMTTASGSNVFVIEIEVNGKVAASSPVNILIDRNPIQDSDIEDTTEFISLKQYAEQANDSKNKAVSASLNAQTAAGSAKRAATFAPALVNFIGCHNVMKNNTNFLNTTGWSSMDGGGLTVQNGNLIVSVPENSNPGVHGTLTSVCSFEKKKKNTALIKIKCRCLNTENVILSPVWRNKVNGTYLGSANIIAISGTYSDNKWQIIQSDGWTTIYAIIAASTEAKTQSEIGIFIASSGGVGCTVEIQRFDVFYDGSNDASLVYDANTEQLIIGGLKL